jgi:hypothetical protein
MSASDHLSQHQFNDVYEMGHGQSGMVPVHALHEAMSAEYLVRGADLEDAFHVDRAPHHTEESMHALTEDVREHGVQRPINLEREFSRFRPDPEHWIADGSHRLLAATRAGQTHVPVKMNVRPQA